jgi:hypothetical protein
MPNLPWGRRRNRFSGPTDSFDELSDDSIEPMRSMSVSGIDSDDVRPPARADAAYSDDRYDSGRYDNSSGFDSESSYGNDSRFDSTDSRYDSEVPPSRRGARRASPSDDQLSDPYLVQHSGVQALSGKFRRPVRTGPPRWRRGLTTFLAIGAILVLGFTLAVAANRVNLGGYDAAEEPDVDIPPPAVDPSFEGVPPVPDPSASAEVPPSPDASASVEPTPPASPPPANGRVALHTLKPGVAADGSSGQRLATVLGAQTFRDSTGVFVSCSEKPATLTYQLGGEYGRLTATAGLSGNATPGDLVARVVISGDGRSLATVTLSLDRSAPVSVNLYGVRTLVVSAQRVRGACRTAQQPFGVLGNAFLVTG